MAFLPAPTIPTSPTAPQGAGVLIAALVPPNTLVLTNMFLPAPTVTPSGGSGGPVGYAM